eukprot:1330853-Amorphochlora_amoeboformis.AAC.1
MRGRGIARAVRGQIGAGGEGRGGGREGEMREEGAMEGGKEGGRGRGRREGGGAGEKRELNYPAVRCVKAPTHALAYDLHEAGIHITFSQFQVFGILARRPGTKLGLCSL